MGKRGEKRRVSFRYARHELSPEDLLTFVELTAFTRRWKELQLDDEADLTGLQLAIMAAPKASPVIPGTDGLRKLRFAPDRWGMGKRGAARVLYIYFEQFHLVLLCLVYGKNELDNISDDAKKTINRLTKEIATELQKSKRIE